jgi:regulator of protease activity HflC (stomatin/prohibitin superfamily)
MQEGMAVSALAAREREAKMQIAQANKEASKMYAEAAEIMKGNEGSIQLRKFETLKEIAGDKSRTIIVPSGLLSVPK